MAGLGFVLPIASEAWSFALGAMAILATAYVARLRYRVQMQRNETDRMVRMAEQANRTYELSLQEKAASLTALFVELARLNLEVRRTELAHDHEVSLAAE